MKYYEIIIQALTYALNEDIDCIIDKDTFKQAKLFFSLNELNKIIPLNESYLKLLNELDEILSIKIIDKEASIKLKFNKALYQLKQDDEVVELINDIDNLPNNEKLYIYNYLSNKFFNIYKKIKLKPVTQNIWSAEENILSSIIEILPDLFFTKKGNKYLSSKFYIKDDHIRDKACHFAHELVNSRLFDENDNMYSIIYAEIQLMLSIYYMSIKDKLDDLIELEDYASDNYHDIVKNKYVVAILNNYQKIKIINFNDKIPFNKKILTNQNPISYIDKLKNKSQNKF